MFIIFSHRRPMPNICFMFDVILYALLGFHRRFQHVICTCGRIFDEFNIHIHNYVFVLNQNRGWFVTSKFCLFRYCQGVFLHYYTIFDTSFLNIIYSI